MSVTEYILMFSGSVVVGYVIFFLVLRILPTRLSASHRTQKDEVLAEARKQADFILGEARSTNIAKNQMLLEELSETLVDRQEDLKLAEENLNILESQIQPVTSRVQKLEHDLKQVDQHRDFAQSTYLGKQSKLEEIQVQMRERLEQACRADAKILLRSMSDTIVEQRQLELDLEGDGAVPPPLLALVLLEVGEGGLELGRDLEHLPRLLPLQKALVLLPELGHRRVHARPEPRAPHERARDGGLVGRERGRVAVLREDALSLVERAQRLVHQRHVLLL
jgi:hypothetical protein